MSPATLTAVAARFAVALVVLAMTVSVVGCTGTQDASSTGGTTQAQEAAPAPEEPEPEPEYTSWEIYVNDDDSYQDGGITYSIALNLTATNPSADPAGTYTGSATAKTDSVGEYQGKQLNASAVAKSSSLEFTLEDPSGGGALAQLEPGELPPLSGSGTISMQASGSGTYGQAGGSFGKNSSEPIKVSVEGDKVTLKVPISGHTYTFTGTLSGK